MVDDNLLAGGVDGDHAPLKRISLRSLALLLGLSRFLRTTSGERGWEQSSSREEKDSKNSFCISRHAITHVFILSVVPIRQRRHS